MRLKSLRTDYGAGQSYAGRAMPTSGLITTAIVLGIGLTSGSVAKAALVLSCQSSPPPPSHTNISCASGPHPNTWYVPTTDPEDRVFQTQIDNMTLVLSGTGPQEGVSFKTVVAPNLLGGEISVPSQGGVFDVLEADGSTISDQIFLFPGSLTPGGVFPGVVPILIGIDSDPFFPPCAPPHSQCVPPGLKNLGTLLTETNHGAPAVLEFRLVSGSGAPLGSLVLNLQFDGDGEFIFKPFGIPVDVSEAVRASIVPEPANLALVGSGLAGLLSLVIARHRTLQKRIREISRKCLRASAAAD